MIWLWLALALTLGASLWSWKGMEHTGLVGFAFLTFPVLFAAIPLVWRRAARTRAAVASAVLLAAYSLNPLILDGQIVYLPATIVMFIAAWRISGEKLFTARVN